MASISHRWASLAKQGTPRLPAETLYGTGSLTVLLVTVSPLPPVTATLNCKPLSAAVMVPVPAANVFQVVVGAGRLSRRGHLVA